MSRNNNYQRKDRLGELLREILSDALTKIDDPALELVSITKVEVDNNLNRAHVLITTLGKTEGSALRALQKNVRVFVGAINDQARIRQIPELVFEVDEGLKATQQIEGILDELDAGVEK